MTYQVRPMLLGIDGPRVRVEGLDAIDGTPVLDIKRYIHYGDRVEDTRVPEWNRRLEERPYEQAAPSPAAGRKQP